MRPPFKTPVTGNHFPSQLTPLIGRADEVQEITRLLANPACRLLTLVGIGGIGKTRLAVQIAAELPDSFEDGVYVVRLQAVESSDFFVSALADTLSLALSGREDPQVQLLTYLADKKILLVLDNFEQLLSPSEEEVKGGREIISQILAGAPGVKLLVTSREVLNRQEEWLYQVPGLPFPASPLLEREAPEERYSAIQLFVERARRVRQEFSLAAEQAGVIRICQLVAGVPLALELAASWTKTLRCADIATEIERNLDFLATTRHNVSEQQRSMRAVFDSCWRRLGEKERSAFKRLSVFRGGFRREAAERVTGADLPILSALVDKSLLRWEADGRYQIHELLRQYAAEQLVLSPEFLRQAYEGHCTYYVNFLAGRLEYLRGGRQQEATTEIVADLENIRAAWQWAVELADVVAIQKSSEAIALFNQFQGRYLETVTTFQRAAERLKESPRSAQVEFALAGLLISLGWACIRLGRLAEAEVALAETRTLYGRLGGFPPGYTTDPRLPLGIIALIRGDYAEAARLGQEARQFNEARSYLWNLQLAHYILARAALSQGQYEAAQHHAQQAYLTTQATQDVWFKAYCLNELGNVAGALGDYTAAKGYYQASYTLRELFNDPEGMAVALNHLAEIAWRQAEYSVARQLYQQSLATYRKINDRGGLATSLNGLARVAVVQGDYPTAQQQFQQALQIALEIQFVPLILSLLIGVGELLLRVGRTERGRELLRLAFVHPAGDDEMNSGVQHLLSHYKIESFSTEEDHPSGEIEELVQIVQLELVTPLPVGEPLASVQSRAKDNGNQRVTETGPSPTPLSEPLSERELEVLRLVATGRQNQEIAAELVVALSTIKTHINNIYRKLDVTNRVQAVSRAKELHLL